MDPTSISSKLDQSVKAIIILLAALSVCIGFFLKLIDDQAFMPFVYTVIGAAFGRGMNMMTGFTKTTETGPDGTKKETTQTTTPVLPPTVVTTTTPEPVTIVNAKPVPVDVITPPKETS